MIDCESRRFPLGPHRRPPFKKSPLMPQRNLQPLGDSVHLTTTVFCSIKTSEMISVSSFRITLKPQLPTFRTLMVSKHKGGSGTLKRIRISLPSTSYFIGTRPMFRFSFHSFETAFRSLFALLKRSFDSASLF